MKDDDKVADAVARLKPLVLNVGLDIGDPVETVADLPATCDTVGRFHLVNADLTGWVWDGDEWLLFSTLPGFVGGAGLSSD